MVVDRKKQSIHSDTFHQLTQYLEAGDVLVLNNTRVIRARLHGHKATGGKVEIFLLDEEEGGAWRALVRPSAKVAPGTVIQLAADQLLRVGERLDDGKRRIHFETPDVLALLEAAGEIPLPPYIHREEAQSSDLRRYQTVFAEEPGAVAAPTAGLHYTDALLDALAKKGVEHVSLTLHVGYGTFKPITADSLEDHRVDPEWFSFSQAAADTLNRVRRDGGRIVAVGTTSTRVLETQWQDGRFVAGEGQTHTYIYPPYTFRGVDILQTNFHLPKSSLLALVCAFGGTDLVLRAYHQAITEEYRFYSYGDAMLIL